MKIIKKKEDSEEYELISTICDFCSEIIQTDNVIISHIFSNKSKIAPGHRVEIDICEDCFLERIYNQISYQKID